MTTKRKGNAKTATTVAALVGTVLQPASTLRPPCSPTSSMRQRRLTTSASVLASGSVVRTGIDAYSTTWGGAVSTSRSRFGTSRSTRLSESPFDNYEYDEDKDITSNNTSVLRDRGAGTATTEMTKTIGSEGKRDESGERHDGATAIYDDGDTSGASNPNFEIPLAVVDVDGDSQDNDESRRLVISSEKLVRFLQEEAPPISILLLNLVAVIWGSQHAIIKTVVEDSDPAAFTFLRFGLASLIASPYLPGVKEIFQKTTSPTESNITTRVEEEEDLWKPWRWGIEMGLWMFLGFSLQAIGLQSTTAQRSGFLLYLNVKFVPFFAYILLGRQISKWTWLSAFAAFSGTALLALDGESLGLNVGDIWSIMAAAASAMFILRLEKASSEVTKASELNATSLVVVAMLSGAWLLLGGNGGPQIASEVTRTALEHPLELVYLGAVSTALANFIQAKAQKDVPAERASIIYSLDPVYGAFFSWIILGESLGGPQAYIGASIIFIAAATNSLLEFSKDSASKE
ncbi:unnamed protein product [Pseudo-nitzschia multistriata]|uniref:EamA domain-containing protein n=1 Tax=Pseudo-nitzschia multistriata TaxID=183589 RepID=A0A448ZFK9_9STRA|nr:unnamed protein product [Pseudo-nitzschia multistriata]